MIRVAAPLLALLLAAPASARIVSATPAAFRVQQDIRVAAAPERVWSVLVAPSRWWSAQHTISGDAANLALGERAGGCFCETLPGGGAVEHARVVRIEPGRLLRLVGGLGPFQEQPAAGPLSFELAADGKGTRLRISYAVAGATLPPLDAMAPLVDSMLAEQAARLKAAAEK